MVHKGFVLVEWMLHFLLCTLIGMFAFALFRTWSTRLISLHRGLDATLRLPSAFDALRRDLQIATGSLVEIHADRCKITQDNHAQYTLWQFKNGTLFRSQKKYDLTQKKWRKAVKNVAAEKLASCMFVPLYGATGAGIITGLKVQCGNPAGEYVFGLRNGKQL